MSNLADNGTPAAPASTPSPTFDVEMVASSPFKLVVPFVIVMGTGALAYTQAPKLTGYFTAPPPVVAYRPPAPPIAPQVAAIPTPAHVSQPVAEAPKVATPKTIVHAKPKMPVVHHARLREIEHDPPPPPYVYRVYPRPYQQAPYQQAYVPVPIPLPFGGGHGGGRMLGGFGGFGRR